MFSTVTVNDRESNEGWSLKKSELEVLNHKTHHTQQDKHSEIIISGSCDGACKVHLM